MRAISSRPDNNLNCSILRRVCVVRGFGIKVEMRRDTTPVDCFEDLFSTDPMNSLLRYGSNAVSPIPLSCNRKMV